MADAVIASPGIVVMLGAVDTGKTTTAARLAGAALGAGWRTAVVDADTGQSDLGPPAAVGLGFVQEPAGRMTDIPLAGLRFAGDTSPQPVYRYVVEGTRDLIARARRRGARIVVVDTTGWVEGAAAVAAKVRKIRRIAPRHIVAIQRDREIEPILDRVPPATAVHRLRPAGGVRRRSREERRAARERRFAGYFAGARLSEIDLRKTLPQRPVLVAGVRIPASRVLHDVPAAALRHLLVGLTDRRGSVLAMGTIVHADPDRHRLSVMAPGGPLDRAGELQWGLLRVAPSGLEEGRLYDMPAVAP